MRKTWTALATIVATATLLAAVLAASSIAPSPLAADARGGARENRALERAGHLGVPVDEADLGRITRSHVRAVTPLAAAPGWAGEIKLGTEDTWEPTIAADPSGPYVYVMYNRFGGPKACKQCPAIPMKLRVSADNGLTWGAETYPCPCPGVNGFQYDPVAKVANTGVVYATWMNRYDIVFSKSSNHGATWTAPIEVSGQPWADKPWIGVSPNGNDVYIAYSTSSDVWIAASHNAGASFAPAVKLNNDTNRYRYPNGLEVLANGTAVLSASDYPGSNQQASGAINIETWRTTNGGIAWTRTVLGQVFSGVNFETSSTTALASDAAGTLVALYSGATSVGGNGHIWTRRSTDGGVSWSGEVELGIGTSNASFPAVTGGASGVFRLHYADNRTGSWNTFYRASTDGGLTWSGEIDISDADAGATYKTAAGFSSEYGDYGAIDFTNTGKTVAVWGEGVSFSAGPGGIWFNRMS